MTKVVQTHTKKQQNNKQKEKKKKSKSPKKAEFKLEIIKLNMKSNHQV